MSVRRRTVKGEARWDVLWRDGETQRSRTFHRKRDADAFEADVIRRKQLGAFAPNEPSRQLVGEYLEDWFRSESHRWAASTRKQRGWILDRWIDPYLCDVRLCDFAQAAVGAWVSAIRADGCPATQANHALSVLSSALGHAARVGKLPANPAIGVRRVPVAITRPRAMTPIEVERIRAAMPTLRDRALTSLLCLAGLRPSEAFALTWDSVCGSYLLIDASYTAGELKGTKTGQTRHVDLIAPVADDLDALRPPGARGGDLVAPNRDGGPLDLRVWRRRVWKPACRRANVSASPYCGRHTFASLLAAEGRLPIDVANQLGHSTSKTTDRYSHLFRPGDHAPRTPMVAAVCAARAEAGAAPRVGRMLDGRPTGERHLRAV